MGPKHKWAFDVLLPVSRSDSRNYYSECINNGLLSSLHVEGTLGKCPLSALVLLFFIKTVWKLAEFENLHVLLIITLNANLISHC